MEQKLVMSLPALKTTMKIGIKTWNKGGDLLVDRVEPGHSWVRNAHNYVALYLLTQAYYYSTNFGDGFVGLKTTGALLRSNFYLNDTNPRPTGYNAAQGVATYGILVGSGDTAFSFNDINLAAQILHGITAGRMTHQATNMPTISYDAGTKTYSIGINRYFNNNSGGTVTVKEAALVSGFSESSYLGVLIARDVLASPVAVVDAGQLLVTYTVSMTIDL